MKLLNLSMINFQGFTHAWFYSSSFCSLNLYNEVMMEIKMKIQMRWFELLNEFNL